MPASRVVVTNDQVTTGKTTWNGEGLQAIALAPILLLQHKFWVNPVASLHMGDLCKAVVTHGKASAGLLFESA